MKKENRLNEKILIDKILEQDWKDEYSPSSYNPSKLKTSLISLVNVCKNDDADEMGFQVLNALGNNHCGTYYPIALLAIDILITIEESSVDNKERRNYTRALLNDLFYFELEMIGGSEESANKIAREVKQKLFKYSDEKYINDN